MQRFALFIAIASSLCLSRSAKSQQSPERTVAFSAGGDSTLPVAPLLRLNYRLWGATVGVIDSTTIATSTAATFSELLQAQLPGLRVLRQGGALTDGSLIMLRGPVSLAGSSAPLVIVDGMRVDARQADAVLANSSVIPSRLDDLVPDDIARIEVLTGAAAAMYGSGAANGVILVSTKSGGFGRLRLSGRADSRTDVARDEFPANYRRVGVTPGGAPAADCSLQAVAAGTCHPTGLDSWNPLEQASRYRIANSENAHVAVVGNALGTNIYASANGGARTGVLPFDDAQRFGLRAKLSRALPGWFYVEALAARQQENAHRGADGNTLAATAVTPNGLFGAAENTINDGYVTLGQVADASVNPDQRLTRTTLGARVTWNPRFWLDASGFVGADHVVGHSTSSLTVFMQFPTGTSTTPENDDETDRLTTTSARLTTRYNLSILSALTSVGIERWRSNASTSDMIGSGSRLSLSETRSDQQSTAISIMQNFVHEGFTTALWVERASDPLLSTEWYPGANLSWQWMNGYSPIPFVRLHAAYAEAPGAPLSLAELFSGLVFVPSGSLPSLPPPERTKNLDAGVDASLGRSTELSVAVFHSLATNLRAPVVGPSAGFVAPLVATNEMVNNGVEATVRIEHSTLRAFGWDVAVRVAALRNRVTRLDVPPVVIRSGPGLVSGAIRSGSPLLAPTRQAYTYADLNGDGIISQNEVQLGQVEFAGSPLPTFESALQGDLHLPGGLTLDALLDYRGGMSIVNETAWHRCVEVGNCQAVQDPSASLADQAAAVAGQLARTANVVGYVEDASFLKLRELALRWAVPRAWTRAIHSGAELTVAGRNLATVTRYRGADPEISSSAASALPRQDFGRTPLPRELVVRIDVGELSRL